MKYTFYLHDLFYEIGHSNVTIDMINNLPHSAESEFYFVVYTADDKKKIFPNIHQNIHYHFLPFKNIKPTFLKIIFYQLYSFFHSLFVKKDNIKVSLGVSNFNSDFSVIHFIHRQWSSIYFNNFKLSPIRFLYKKVFFSYLNLCEDFYFKKRNLKVITVSNFLNLYLKSRFPNINIKSIHSGFEVNRFKQLTEEKIGFLQKSHPILKEVDFTKAVCLFVGAFERKGAKKLIELWQKNHHDAHLIMIGKAEKNIELNHVKNLTHIEYTSEIDLFYQVCDYFFFPTIYEPFGMVLIEAAMYGMKISTTKENVGAAEILENFKEVEIFHDNASFRLPNSLKKLSPSERDEYIKERKVELKYFSWTEISKKYYDFFNNR